MAPEHKHGLTLVVANAQALESGLSAQVRFVDSGGVIGSDFSADWRLTDRLGRVSGRHCEVVVVDGAFCVRDDCGETFVNGTHMPLGKGQLARLAHKDEIQVGPYQIRVHTGEDAEFDGGHVDTLFETQQHDLLADGPSQEIDSGEEEPELTQAIDPLKELDAQNKDNQTSNWLLNGDKEQKQQTSAESSLIAKDNLVERKPSFTPQADSEDVMSASVKLKRIFGFGQKKSQKREFHASKAKEALNRVMSPETMHQTKQSERKPMDEKELGLLEQEVAKSLSHEPTSSPQSNNDHGQHLLTGPMLDGLGVRVTNDHDMQKMHFLSQEMGQSLQACLKGLLALHEQAAEGRFGTMNRNLQPIEDNPLRLGLTYEETVRTMYDADKSLVHLSAPAAIAESLKNVRDHNDATQEAISEALDQILHAFSPDVLLRRFQHCRRNTDEQIEGESAWAWEMYCNYYKELTSNRQRGFSKLFWEIFEQVYDKRIREKQLEG